MNNSQFPTARKLDLVVQEVPNEVLVFDLNTNKAHCLNKTAAMVWQNCDGTRSASQIAELVSTQAGGKVSEDLVWLAIDQLNDIDLLENKIQPKFGGQSRRDVIKKVGLAAVIGLPIVASLAAPTSALASTSCACSSQPSGVCAGACGSFCDTGIGRCVI